MYLLQSLFYFFLLSLLAFKSLNAQNSADKNQLFENLAVKLLDNAAVTKLQPLNSIALASPCKSVCPCNPVKLTVINLSNKRLKAVWVDYGGAESQTVYIASNTTGSSITLDSYSNHCFRVYLDADNANSQSFYAKAPTSDSTFYSGDLSLLKQEIYNTGWLSNTNANSLQQFQKLADYQKVPLRVPDFGLLRSTYYDDSAETETKIQEFFNGFNENNKFIDPTFNPLNKIDSSKYSPKRVGEYQVKLPKIYNASVYLGSNFVFSVTNDIGVDLKVFWIDYSSTAKSFGTLSKGQSQTFNSFLGNVYALATSTKTYIIDLGKAPFLQTNVKVAVSKITNILNVNIETVQDNFISSIIINQTDLEQYNSRQGQIGNCWFLQTVVSTYARYPDLITSKFIKPDLMSKTGVVAVKLYSNPNNAWRLVVMDDFLNQDKSSGWFGSSPSGPLKNRFWVPLLEKAFAKQVAAFPNLEAGSSSISIPNAYQMLLGPKMNRHLTISIPATDTTKFDQLADYYKNGSVIGFSSRPSTNGQLIDSITCMVHYHGYGLLEIRENVANSGFSFVKAQNTWSQGGEWCGDWGDNSALWNKYPNVKAALNFESKDEGAFWVEKKDFSKAFSVMWIATVN